VTQDTSTLGFDQQIILDANADAAVARCHFGSIRGEVQPRLDRDHDSRLQWARLALVEIATHVVHVHTQIVAGFVHEIGFVAAGRLHLLRTAAEDPELDQPLADDARGHLMQRFERDTGSRSGNAGLLRGQHHLVRRPLRRAEAAVHGESASDVRGVVAIFAAGIDQEQITVLHLPLILHVVQDSGVRAGAHDGLIRDALAAACAKGPAQQRFDLVLIGPRPRAPHRCQVSLRADGDGSLEERHLLTLLVASHLVHQRGHIHQRARTTGSSPHLAARCPECAHQPLIDQRVTAKTADHVRAIQEQPR
jgi:hypothetical protein